MIDPRDELLHEFKRSEDWIERYSLNIVDKKARVYGFVDINFMFHQRKTEYIWALYCNDNLYTYTNLTDLDSKPNQKLFSDGRIKYKILSPREKVEVNLKNDVMNAGLTLSGAYPVYVFPLSATAPERGPAPERVVELWERYEQRCKVSGSVTFTKGERKGTSKRIECMGMRKHSWGLRSPDGMSCYSWITIQFRDMAMDLTYMELDGRPYSGGFISRRSGNIPIVEVEMELVSLSKDNSSLISTEFSYRDAQDDRDLIVSRRLHSLEMSVPRHRKGKFVRLRAFSDFTIIGTNKKGVGMEDHYISFERLRKID
ncbi:MAG: hypothetical protein EPN93_08205 [Spirochaetes bacterium]|nr:MAG: hypothetical protein EPN93_08205 [Spirochaetota bacterium]